MQNLGQDSRGITKTPGVCCGTACIANTRIPVWSIVEVRCLGYSEADLITSYLTATDLTQDWILPMTQDWILPKSILRSLQLPFKSMRPHNARL
jgi:uncharacterized protein (DUF433 family)